VSVSAVVPAKAFARAKSRLVDVLDAPSRAALAREMLAHVLETLRATEEIGNIVVVTDGEDVEALALAYGARCVRDRGEPPLRLAVDVGLDELSQDADALVVMADLPWLTSTDVRSLVAGLGRADVVVAPDATRHGTNALALSSRGRMRTSFGSGESFAEHLARAKGAGLVTHVVESRGLAFDVDTPADLAELRAVSGPPSFARAVGNGTGRRA
jgi:2-phospho-L-lactate/phosphoenolpyruvate guanylyltransferase